MRTCLWCQGSYEAKDKRRKFCSNRCYWERSSKIGNAGQFRNGFKPWNKNKKGIHLSPQTEFKKGQLGTHWVPVGSVRVRFDKCGTRRKWIKIKEPNVWIEYAKHVWLSAGRSLHKGLCLHHINNRSDDDRIENLLLVTREQHPKLHNQWNTKNKIQFEMAI